MSTEHESTCNPHPDAPHGFDRSSSAEKDRYVCDCEHWVSTSPHEQAVEALAQVISNMRGLLFEHLTPTTQQHYRESARAALAAAAPYFADSVREYAEKGADQRCNDGFLAGLLILHNSANAIAARVCGEQGRKVNCQNCDTHLHDVIQSNTRTTEPECCRDCGGE